MSLRKRIAPLPEVTTVPALFEKDGTKHKIPGHKAIINPITNHVFGIASDKYKLVTHEEVMNNVEEVIFKSNKYGNWTKAISTDKEGAKLRATYKFLDVEIPIGNNKDLISPTIEVFNSYDLSWRHTVMIGAYRMICENGIVVGENFLTFKKKHSPSLYLEDVKYAVEGGLETMTEQATQWTEWNNVVEEQKFVNEVIKNMKLNNKEKEELINTREVSSNLKLVDWLTFTETTQIIITRWVFFNIVTQFLTHNIKKETRRVQLESAFRNNIYR